MKILDKLELERVVQFKLFGDKSHLNVIERCDMCFETNLTKNEVIQLISELQYLADQMINPQDKD